MGISAGMIKSIVLQVVGGSPLKGASTQLSEGLKVAQKLTGSLGSSIPGLGSISGITDVIQNPISNVVNTAKSSLQTAMTSISGQYAGLASQMQGALGNLDDLHTMADKLSGAAIPDVGDFGIHDAIQLASSNVSGVNLATLTAPLNSTDLVNTLSATASDMAAKVQSGVLTEAEAISTLQGPIDQITGVMANTTNAFATATAAVTTDAHLNQMFNHLADSAASPDVKNLITSVIQPDKLSAIQSAVSSI